MNSNDTRPAEGGIAVVDIGALVTPDASPAEVRRAVDGLAHVCATGPGTFYIVNHGISADERTATFDAVKRFFDLPLADKMALSIGRSSSQFRGYVPMCGEVTGKKRDWHECIDLQPLAGAAEGGDGASDDRHPLDDPGQWPEALPVFREAMMRRWSRMYRLGSVLTNGIALGLGLPDGYFDAFAGNALCSLRLSHYPSFTDGAAAPDIDAGMGAHYDLGFLAVLDQDETGGLEVRLPDGTWMPARPMPGTLAVNIGLMIQRWTNDRYRASFHRVSLRREASRYSVPFFFEPRADTVVEPLAGCCGPDRPPRYEPIRFGEFMNDSFSVAYRN